MARFHLDLTHDALDERLSLAGIEAVEVVAEAREVARHGRGRGFLEIAAFLDPRPDTEVSQLMVVCDDGSAWYLKVIPGEGDWIRLPSIPGSSAGEDD